MKPPNESIFIPKGSDVSENKPKTNFRAANIEFQQRRQKHLRANQPALAWIKKTGLTDETIRDYKLGLSPAYIDKEQATRENALLAPVLSAEGVYTNQTIYCNLRGITLNPGGDNRWMRGSPATYHAEKFAGQTSVLVLDDLFDLWLTQQALDQWKDKINILIVCSTHPDDIPSEWFEPPFWERFERIYLGHGNNAAGDLQAVRISQTAGRETRRVRLPLNLGKTWSEFWQKGNIIEDFYRLLSEADIIGAEISKSENDTSGFGRFGYQPVDIGTAFHRGLLYYPVRTLLNSPETYKDGQGAHMTHSTARIETVVVRSDRTVHTVVEEPAPRGTPLDERVFRLTDGTLIESIPKASAFSTWSWNSIRAFQENRTQTRPLKVLLEKIKTFLRNSVWLPYDYDYDLLTLLVPVTFAQAVFQSVPMVLVTGPPASGKSALGRAMCLICANAAAVGQISAAAVARLIHGTKGFVLLDDLESIGKRSSKREAPVFNDLIQALKLSYNKETSCKIWTDVSRRMRVQKLNFFGVKMINNTSGTDDILGSRMLQISTRKMPRELQLNLGRQESKILSELGFLRDELHTWTFENVALIDTTYKRLFPYISDRDAEISAPLRVFAEIAGDAELTEGLETALKVKSGSPPEPLDDIEVMVEAVKRLAREGYQSVSATHVALEMKKVSASNEHQQSNDEPLRWENPAWVGRHLRTYELIDTNAPATRQLLFGKSLRVYRLNERFLAEIHCENKNPAEYLKKQPLDFCSGCADCRYRSVNCSFVETRVIQEGKFNSTHR